MNVPKNSDSIIGAIAIVLLLFGSVASAQDSVVSLPRYFKLCGSLSMPVGEFSSTTSAQAGFAKPGFGVAGEFDAEVIRGFEMGVMALLSLHELDAAEIQRQIRRTYSDGSVQSGMWLLVHMMGGAGFSLPASSEVMLYGKMYVGAIVATFPEVRIYVGGVQAKQASSSATALSYGFGCGMMITKKIDAGVRYLTAEPEYQLNVVAGQISSNQTVTQTATYKQPIGILHFSVGYIIH